MRFLLVAVNSKYIHSNPAVYSLRAYAKAAGLPKGCRVELAEYTINEQVEQYGTDRLVQALNAVKDEQIDHILPSVSRNLSAFTGNADQFDDITMLGFTYFGPEENALTD